MEAIEAPATTITAKEDASPKLLLKIRKRRSNWASVDR